MLGLEKPRLEYMVIGKHSMPMGYHKSCMGW